MEEEKRRSLAKVINETTHITAENSSKVNQALEEYSRIAKTMLIDQTDLEKKRAVLDVIHRECPFDHRLALRASINMLDEKMDMANFQVMKKTLVEGREVDDLGESLTINKSL